MNTIFRVSCLSPFAGVRRIAFLSIVALSLCCTSAESKNVANSPVPNAPPAANANAASRGATIDITTGGPADTVRAFYRLLREKKFRDALFLTNLRPAIESLTDTELKDFSLDFEAIAGDIPAEVEINGEIISGDLATVTANLPDPEEDGKKSLQQIKLKKTGEVWVILTADADTEAKIKKDGSRYFYNLRIETHEAEASRMLERVAKAQVAYSLQHDNQCADMATLLTAGLLPEDIGSSATTGYNYVITLTDDKRRYFATATPAEYGRTGTRSFLLDVDGKGLPHISGKDNGGKTLKK